MHSVVYKRDRCGSDPTPAQRYHMTEASLDSGDAGTKKMPKMDLLEGQLSPRLSVDNIYESIVNV